MRDQLNAALAAASRVPDEPHRLDDHDRCELRIPLPPGLIEGLEALDVTVRLSADDSSPIVTFLAPLASFVEGEIPDEFAASLLRRQFTGTQTEGASFAIADREDVLVAVYHWLPEAITDEAFARVFGRFVSAAIMLHGEVMGAAAQGAPVVPFTTD